MEAVRRYLDLDRAGHISIHRGLSQRSSGASSLFPGGVLPITSVDEATWMQTANERSFQHLVQMARSAEAVVGRR